MKKYLAKALLGLLAVGSSFSLWGQQLPPIEGEFKKIKANPKVYETLKEDYGIENPKACKFEMLTGYNGGETWKKSTWLTSQSPTAQKLVIARLQKWPDDRATAYFRVTTPKNKDGISYVLPLMVEYTRLEEEVLTDSWDYLWWRFGAPIKTEGKLMKDKFYSMLIDYLKNTEYKYNPGGYSPFPKALVGCYKIHSIYDSPKMDYVEKYSNVERITRTYCVDGDFLYMPGSSYDTVHRHWKHRVNVLKVEFSRKLKFADQEEGDWEVTGYPGGRHGTFNDGEEIKDYRIRPTIERIGYDAVYQKDNPIIGKAYFSSAYQDEWEEGFEIAANDLYNGVAGAEERLKPYFKDESQVASLKALIAEVKSKMCYLKPYNDKRVFHVSLSYRNMSDNVDKTGKIYFQYGVKRDKCYDNTCKKKYKAGGMSKDLIKKGGSYYESESYDLKIELKNNQFVLSEYPKLKNQIDF